MAATKAIPQQPRSESAALERRFEAIVFDWDGTAVPDRAADATRLRALVEAACRCGLHLVVVTGTHVGNVDGQLRARPDGPGSLHLLVNRGAEAYRVAAGGPVLLERRRVTRSQRDRLAAAAEATVGRLQEHGMSDVRVIARPNRVKVDLIPEPGWADPPKARIAELADAVARRLHGHGIAGLDTVVRIAADAARAAGLDDPRVTTDAKHVEIGVTDKADSARWALAWLGSIGVAAPLVVVAGDEFGALGGALGSDSLMLVDAARDATAVSVGVEPGGVPSGVIAIGGGPDAFLGLLEDQIERRRRGELPRIAEDPAWSIRLDGGSAELERVRESLLSLADGRIGTRGSAVCELSAADPAVFAAGVYRGHGPTSELLRAPRWNRIDWHPPPEAVVRRVLDLRTGVLGQEIAHGAARVDAFLFSSAASPGTTSLRATATAATGADWGAPLAGPGVEVERAVRRAQGQARVHGEPGGVAVAAAQREQRDATGATLERVAAYRTNPRRCPSSASATQALARAEAAGPERLLNEHRAAMAGRWEDAAISIEGDPELDRAVKFCLYHLMGSAGVGGEAAVGARGLTGTAYRGHVFWDADVFVLPFLAATRPHAARAMLEYRVRRLPAARAEAAAEGTAGAHMPWESAATGEEVTPTRGRDRLGRFTAIRTGQLEEHIVADVAWAAAWYADWTGDSAFLDGAGRELLLETARWWAERIELDPDARAHIRGVIGPDEYHAPVDDNAFTNVMARWNLRRAADLADALHDAGVTVAERSHWRTLADALVDGYDPATGIYEQFAGFHRLEPLLIAEVASARPVAASLLLGPERVTRAQVVKQADVLMLHHLVPDAVVEGSLPANLAHYEPRTAHGSSLSPGVHAALLARAGRPDEARDLLALTASIDLDDITQTTAGGVHLASMGSVWQALVRGFAGLRAEAGALRIDPHLPEAWDSLEIRLRFRGARVRLELGDETTVLHTDRPIRVRTRDTQAIALPAGSHRIGPTETGGAP